MKAATDVKSRPELIHTQLHELINVVYYRSLGDRLYVIVNSHHLPEEVPTDASSHLEKLLPGQCMIL